METNQEIYKKFRNIVAKVLMIEDAENIKPESHLIELGMDSLDFVAILFECNEVFNINIQDNILDLRKGEQGKAYLTPEHEAVARQIFIHFKTPPKAGKFKYNDIFGESFTVESMARLIQYKLEKGSLFGM